MVHPLSARRRVSYLALALLVGALPLAACADREAPSGAAEAPVAGSPAGVSGDAAKTPSASRALKITTDTKIASKDVEGTVAALRTAVADAGGYVSDARLGGNREEKNANLEARIPADKLASFRAGLSNHGEILSDTEKAEDVTEQRADLKARLRNARTQEKRLLDLLSDKTGSLADIIAAEKALAEIRDTIERLEAQETVLEGQIAFATVKLHIVPKGEPAAVGAGDKIVAAGKRGVSLAGSMVVGIVLAIATIGPAMLILLAIGLVTWLLGRKLVRRFAAQSAAKRPLTP
jgi:hypothetical protein